MYFIVLLAGSLIQSCCDRSGGHTKLAAFLEVGVYQQSEFANTCGD